MADAKGVYKQDMVVSTRYRNDLPPPPMPPKLLNIDTGGIEQYLTPGFAAAMARREEPNIEADAEGGMPIDMIGIPGYFLGDESAIMAPEHQPLLDPADMALMATPDQLRNASGKSANVSFLRRTQYISAVGGARADTMLRNTTVRPKPLKSTQPDRQVLSRDDPVYIKRYIRKGFDIAYPESKQAANQADSEGSLPISHAELEAWRNPIHPENHRLKPVEFYPILPDLDSVPEQGGYASLKFDKPPLPVAENGKRDERIDVGLLQAAVDQEAFTAYQASLKAYESNPEHYDHPGEPPLNLALHIAKGASDVSRIRTVFNDAHPSKDSNPTVDGNPEQFEYQRQRIYTIANRSTVQENTYRSIALSLFDPSPSSTSQHSRLKSSGQRAAYYYPVQQIMKLRTRPPNTIGAPEESGVSDAITLMVHEPDEEKVKSRAFHRAQVDSHFKKEYEERYPKEPTPPPPEPEPASQQNGNGEAAADLEDSEDEKMTGNEERELRDAAAGVVGRNGTRDDEDDDMDAEGEADDSE